MKVQYRDKICQKIQKKRTKAINKYSSQTCERNSAVKCFPPNYLTIEFNLIMNLFPCFSFFLQFDSMQ